MKKALSLILSLLLLSSFALSCTHTGTERKESQTGEETVHTVPATEPPETEPLLPERFTYKSVIVLGVDGAGVFKTDTPNLDRIFKEGAVCAKMPTAIPTISAQCWGTLLTGVTPSVHHFTNDSISSGSVHGNKEHPTFFKLVKNAIPDASLAAFCNWSPVYGGIIESGIGVTTGTGDDAAVTSQILAYLDKKQPTVLFAQFDGVDHVGHSTGYNNAAYYREIRTVDGYIGKIYDKIVEKGYADDTLFIVTADHGGIGTSHGGLSDEEKYVFFGAVGKSVLKNDKLSLLSRDLPAVVTCALNVPGADNWDSYLPASLFSDNPSPAARPEEQIAESVKAGGKTPEKGSGSYLTEFLDEAKIRTWLPFDGDMKPAIGNIEGKKNGTVYYVEGVNGSALRVSSEGTAAMPSLMFGKDSFSISAWVRIESLTGDPPIYSNKNWQDGYNRGFVLCAREIMKFNVGTGSGTRSDFEYAYPTEKFGDWMHTLLVVNREKNTVLFYVNFVLVGEDTLSSVMKTVPFDADGMTFGIGNDGTGRYSSGTLTAEYDDLLVCDGALSSEEIGKLKAYYLDRKN